MNVFLLGEGKIVVDNQRNLLDINTSGKQISGDQNSGWTSSEFSHNKISVVLGHVTVHRWNGEVLFLQLGGQFLNLLLLVAIDDTLLDINVVVELDEGIELPVILLNGNVELFNTIKSEFFILDQNGGGISHEILGEVQDLGGHGSGEEGDLDITGDETKDLLDLVLETST